MMDEDETSIIGCALRELKEETGLVADDIVYQDDGSWVYFGDPWKSNLKGTCCVAHIDGDKAVNKKREQNLEDTELIHMVEFDLDENFIHEL